MPNQSARYPSLYHAIYSRRMSWNFADRPVSKSAIERMLDAAVWAPNHRLTEPWRFAILEKGSLARARVADLGGEAIMERTGNERRAAAGRAKVLSPPYVICVYCVPGADAETTKENYAAVCCAAQNISLAGAAEGLAVTWETGGVTRHRELNAAVGAEESWDLVTMLLIGFPGEVARARRTPATSFSRWFAPADGCLPENVVSSPAR